MYGCPYFPELLHYAGEVTLKDMGKTARYLTTIKQDVVQAVCIFSGTHSINS